MNSERAPFGREQRASRSIIEAPADAPEDDELEALELEEDERAHLVDCIAPHVRKYGPALVLEAVAATCNELAQEHEEEAREVTAIPERSSLIAAKETYLSLSFNIDAAASTARDLERQLDDEEEP